MLGGGKSGTEVDCGENKKGLRREVSVITPTSVPVQVIECPEKPLCHKTNQYLLETTSPGWQRRPNHFTDRGCANHTKSSTLPGDPVPQENELTLLRSVAAILTDVLKR